VRRRLVVTIAGVIAAAVAVVGLGTLALTYLDARHRDEEELAARLDELAALMVDLRPNQVGPLSRRIGPSLGVDTLSLERIDQGATPLLSDADIARLAAGDSIGRREGDTAVAAAPLVPATGEVIWVVMATDTVDDDLGPAARWFLVAGAATILVGSLVALRLARSLTGSLAEAEAATARIARGELGARVPQPHAVDDELARLVHAINHMAAELEQARRTEEDFLLSVSHDLRTPLTSISGWAEALADGTAPDATTAGDRILAEAGRLDRLVRDLLDLARLRARAFNLSLRPVDLRDVALGAGEGLRPDLEDAGLALAVDVPAEPVMVDGDADRLAQIAGNLLENAGRHAQTAVRVSVRVARNGSDEVAELAVADDGPGIPAPEREHVFDRLYSGRPSSGSGPGTGVGLATVRALSEAMSGSVIATEAPGGGARLVVHLPLRGPA
jgi:two-component system sensor histidine kinase BaeS